MNPTAAPTPISQRNETLLAAKRAQEQREQGIRANAIKQGRELERKEICEKAGVTVLDDISILHQIRVEHAAADQANELRWMREEAKHGRGEYWKGWAHGGIVMGSLLSAGLMFYALGIVSGTLEAAVPMRAQERIADEIRTERARADLENRAFEPSEPSATTERTD